MIGVFRSSTGLGSAVLHTKWKTMIAFAIIYFVWGSTYFAIRVGVSQMPPLLMAAIRFTVAGLALSVWALARGVRLPNRRQWASITLLAFLIFVMDYGILFWAEQRVPSGVTAVILATIPAFMALAEILWLRTQRLTLRLGMALLIGLAGVVVLIDPFMGVGGAPVYFLGAIGLVAAALSWSGASVLTRLLPLPSSKVMSAGMQMLSGGLFLGLAAWIFGEAGRFQPAAVSGGAWFALLYLIVAGSIVGFTAYTWLIHHESPTKVGTYAYVNPVVAVVIGYFLGGEALDRRTVLGTLFVVVSVLIITSGRTTQAQTRAQALPQLNAERP